MGTETTSRQECSECRTVPHSSSVTTGQRARNGVGRAVEEHLAELTATLDRLAVQVRQAQQLAALGTAATTIAHEVTNLLTPVLGYATAAAAGDDVELMRKALNVTIRSAGLLTAMSDRVLRIGCAKPAEYQLVSIRATAEEAAASLCRDLSKDGIHFGLDVHENLQVWFDPLHLTQVFFNLFLNAREAMAGSHSGRLTVTAARREEQVAIEVRDTGKGIPAELLPHIFDPFQSSKPVDRDGRLRCGGLGLALCQDLIEGGGGTISVESQPNVGTTFTIVLPAYLPTFSTSRAYSVARG